MGGIGGKAEVISSNGCSKLFVDISSSFPSSRGLQSLDPIASPVSPPVASESMLVSSDSPFSGLVICVTGLSKEARKQVKDATERLGGQYSPHLHPQCTHLVVQSFYGHKFEHALNHGLGNGLLVVTLGWFVDSVRRKARLRESLYSIKRVGENGMAMDNLNRRFQFVGSGTSCHPKQSDVIVQSEQKESERQWQSTLHGNSIYVDIDVSPDLRSKVIETASAAGAKVADKWFVGCNVSHVVCEGSSARKYVGHSCNLVTPMWVLKTAKEKRLQRLVHMSADLARQIGMILENEQGRFGGKEINGDKSTQDIPSSWSKVNLEEREKIVHLAKSAVRKRRCRRMQTCGIPIAPITPTTLLDSICWSVSEPTSAASIFTDSLSAVDASENHRSVYSDVKGDGKELEASFVNFTRPLAESEKTELVFKNPFLTILFPVDRFSELGLSSRTFFSATGFTCLQVLDYIHSFYQENMSCNEVEVAIHTDSRHADRLRSVYSSHETAEQGHMVFKRIDFLGSRKSFEMLKRISGDSTSNVYELLIRA